MLKKFIATVCVLALAGCTTAQIASVEATASKYQSAVVAACSTANALANAPGISLLTSISVVTQAVNLVKASCSTEEAIGALVLSPTSEAWLNTLITTISTKGKTVLPAPTAAK